VISVRMPSYRRRHAACCAKSTSDLSICIARKIDRCASEFAQPRRARADGRRTRAVPRARDASFGAPKKEVIAREKIIASVSLTNP
jgi:hypothetical protein